MDKYYYVQAAISVLKGITKEEFQKKVGFVLKEYYDSIKLKYETVSSAGGDKKNDGWVPEKAIFYQFYAPIPKDSLKNDITTKFKNDLNGLVHHVIKENKWKGVINEFIFIVQTFDNDLPENSDDRYNTIVENVKQEFNIDFNYKLDNLDYIEDILNNINDIEVLKRICSKLKVDSFWFIDMIDQPIILQAILKISEEMNNQFAMQKSKNNYKRISSQNKISINNLDEIADKINSIILKLDVVDDAITLMHQSLEESDKFEYLKEKLLNIYNVESKKNKGVELYKIIIKKLSSVFDQMSPAFITATEFLVVYVFDRCDIFEKE